MELTSSLPLGVLAFGLWGFIWWRSRREVLGWLGPTALFAAGILGFYVIPSIYWQFRPWRQVFPPYFEGVPLVQWGAFVLGLPFAGRYLLVGRGRRSTTDPGFRDRSALRFGFGLWWLAVPVAAGLLFRIYLFTQGHQSRLEREALTVAGSTELGLLVSNISYVHSIFYFLLVAFGNRRQRQFGIAAWILDAALQAFSLHRHAMLTFGVRSGIYLSLLGVRLDWRHWAAAACLGLALITLVGETGRRAQLLLGYEQSYLTPTQVVWLVSQSLDAIEDQSEAQDDGALLQGLDSAMARLYEARSASAVMASVPEVLPYRYGSTFLHVLYAFVPRFVWPDKPSLSEIHHVTVEVMPDDLGINPTGTIAELYLNFGFPMVLLGGCVCLLICRATERRLTRRGPLRWAGLAVYPLMAEWFIGANYNFTQRICEGMRGIVLVVFVWALMRLLRRRSRREPAPLRIGRAVAPGSSASRDVVRGEGVSEECDVEVSGS